MANKRRVLIVVSSYRPAMLADMQRARMLAWELPKQGWDVEILTPQISEVRQDVVEPHPDPFFNPETQVHEVGSVLKSLFRALGSNSLAFRTFIPMYLRGNQLLKTGRFDLVYLSTTTFLYFALATIWRGNNQVPYVLDFHDPWVKESKLVRIQPSLKARLSDWLAQRLEGRCVLSAAGLVTVSPKYMESLESRYMTSDKDWSRPKPSRVIPFAFLPSDFELESSCGVEKCADRPLIVNYVGAGGEIMARSFRWICKILRQLCIDGDTRVIRLRIGLYGTSYGWKKGNVKVLQEVAISEGVADLVREEPERVTYRRSLELLLQADGALVLGVDDAGYMPSKLFSYGFSGKPIFAALHGESPAYKIMGEMTQLGHTVSFCAASDCPSQADFDAMRRFLTEVDQGRTFDRSEILRKYTAEKMALEHVELFEACLSNDPIKQSVATCK